MEVKVALLVLVWSAAARGQDTVNTSSGEVHGQFIEPLGITQFLGIPYAEAPEGPLRFKPPVRKARMDGVYEATSNAKICPQVNSNPKLVITEDCLRLDIYAPRQPPASNEKAAVMIWIYGGRYTSGSTSMYNAAFIAGTGRVIVVTVNYRLGVLGFLNTMDENSVGNFGLRDQCSAIEWVVDNIEAFGGDVSRVTIFGESAGAASVMQLAMSSLCKEKFQRVIAESGSPESPWSYNMDPVKSSLKLAKGSGCPSESGALVQCLREKTWQEILTYELATYHLLTVDWVPSYCPDVFPDSPLDILKGENSPGLRRFRSLDFLSGLNNEEGEYPFNQVIAGTNDLSKVQLNETAGILPDAVVEQQIRTIVPLFTHINAYEMERLLPVILRQYSDPANRNEFSNAKSLIQLFGDANFNIGAVGFANIHSRGRNYGRLEECHGRTFFYQFKHKLSIFKTYPWSDGATHVDEIYFVFGYVRGLKGNTQEILLSNRMIQYWTNFAKTGSPNQPALTMSEPEWPAYDEETGAYIKLDLQISTGAFPYQDRVAFWEDVFEPELERIRAEGEQQQQRSI